MTQAGAETDSLPIGRRIWRERLLLAHFRGESQVKNPHGKALKWATPVPEPPPQWGWKEWGGEERGGRGSIFIKSKFWCSFLFSFDCLES